MPRFMLLRGRRFAPISSPTLSIESERVTIMEYCKIPGSGMLLERDRDHRGVVLASASATYNSGLKPRADCTS
jgi:hypothetical protein